MKRPLLGDALHVTARSLSGVPGVLQQHPRSVLEIRPDPVDTVSRPGETPAHVLLFGGGALKGIGLRTHELGLPGGIADLLRAQRGKGVRIDVVVDPNPASSAALRGLRGMQPSRYDAVVVFLGHFESAQLRHTDWKQSLTELISLLVEETGAGTGLFLYDSSAALDAAGAKLSRSATRAARERIATASELCRASQRVNFVELRAPVLPRPDRFRFADGTYSDWSAAITTRLVRSLALTSAHQGPDAPRVIRARPQVEALRQRAVSAHRFDPSRRDAALDREVRLAQQMYGTAAAALTVVDGDQVWTRATTQGVLFGADRASTACDLGVLSDGLLLINDAEHDARVTDRPAFIRSGMRFYAGYPVTSWDGYRLGMVCVMDAAPRACSPRDLGSLREVAARIERLLRREALQHVA